MTERGIIMNASVGERIKEKRLEKKKTLKDIAEATGLSIGYLSQLERGLTSVANDTLKKIAEALDADIEYFVERPKCLGKNSIRSYEREIIRVQGNSIIEYNLTNMIDNGIMRPRLVEILPQKEVEKAEEYSHEGEEFVYVLEGILTLSVNGQVTDLYPGDCAHYKSTKEHNWSNQTNKTTRLLSINV